MERYYCYCYYLALLVMVHYCLTKTSCTANAMKTRSNIDSDQSALLALKAHITSDPHQFLLKNWSSKAPSSSVCDWIGVECGSRRHHRVTALDISNMNLNGTIPPELGDLSFLVALNIDGNYFHGNLPKELWHLPRLRSMNLSLNNFGGTVPVQIGLLQELRYLSLSYNSFVGSIPPSISNLSKLEYLSLQNNFLGGKIPEQFGNLHNLNYLSLGTNQLIDSIPSSIFNMSVLENVGFTNNSLTGSLPVDICHNLPNLEGLYLSANELNGQIPSSFSQCPKLQTLSLSRNKFSGRIPKEIGNCQALEMLYLGGNNLEGNIPPEIGNLSNLNLLSLDNNQIAGSIPREIGNLTMLSMLYLHFNSLTGILPPQIYNLRNLELLKIRENQITGSIGRGIGNLTRLYQLDFAYNNFTGIIPQEISNLPMLEEIYLISNRLNGSVPVGFFNITTLISLVLSFNRLVGNLPQNMGYGLPNLVLLDLAATEIGGVIPSSIANSSRLTVLSLARAHFTGSIPESLGDLSLLETLLLFENNLKSEPFSSELGFITSLTKCKYLSSFQLGKNPLNGVLPASIGNFSTSLETFDVHSCKIKGRIPDEIGNLSNVLSLTLDDNQLIGFIPTTIRDWKTIQLLSLSHNKLEGTLDHFCSLPRLSELYLDHNQISGPISECFGNMTSLRHLTLGNNLLASSIPINFWNLKDLLELNLSSNFLSSSLPQEIGNLKAATWIDMSMNEFRGDIPSTMGGLQNLLTLFIAHNQLQGPIPDSFGNMLSLQFLDLSHNSLSGLIPKSLQSLQYLKYFNVSFNKLEGEIPSGGPFKNFTSESFISNDALCGDSKFHVPRCQTNSMHRSKAKTVHEIVPIILGAVVVVTLAMAFVFLRYRKTNQALIGTDMLSIPTRERISYSELQLATNGYNESNFLGSGSFGSVYKGILHDGKTVAVKVFNLQREGTLKSFEVECEALRNLRHRNLVKVISSCSNQDFKALVLEYMCNGSLEKWLYSHNYFLDIAQRLDIMLDVASALQYLHHEHSTPVIHCDLKPSNVLIDEDMVGHISDFGIAKLLGEESVVMTKTLATIGYIAPEYGFKGIVSASCDVYSYGVMLMEVFTRRRPSDETFSGDLNLKSWVNESMPNGILQIVDTNLLKTDEEHFTKKLECLSSIMELALNCASESPKERLAVKDILGSLKKIKHNLLQFKEVDKFEHKS